jgi:hypothetical protein
MVLKILFPFHFCSNNGKCPFKGHLFLGGEGGLRSHPLNMVYIKYLSALLHTRVTSKVQVLANGGFNELHMSLADVKIRVLFQISSI